MIKFTIITPTILRPSLKKACLSIDKQDYPKIQHLVMVDKSYKKLTNEENQLLGSVKKHYRDIIFVEGGEARNDTGNFARYLAYNNIKGDYVMHLDDDDWYIVKYEPFKKLNEFLAEKEYPDFVYFPCWRDGSVFYNHPPGSTKTASNQYIYKPIINGKEIRYPEKAGYLEDGKFLDNIVSQTKPARFDTKPLVRIEHISGGRKKLTTFEEFRKNGNKINQ